MKYTNYIKLFILSVFFIFTAVIFSTEEKTKNEPRIYQYNKDNVSSFSGVLGNIMEEHWYSSEFSNLTTDFRTEDGKVYKLDLGMKDLYKDNLPSLGQKISVRGSLITDNKLQIILSEKVQLSTGEDIKVRSSKGVPVWQKTASRSLKMKSFRYNMMRMRRKH